MNERELFKKTFDAVPAPEHLAQRAAARAQAPQRAPRRGLRLAVLAVLAVALLSACAVAVQMIKSKPDLIEQCNAGLDRLRELGLFHAEFEVTMDDQVPDLEADYVYYYDEDSMSFRRPELTEDQYEGVVELRGYHRRQDDYSYDLDVDTDTGKIVGLNINAKPQADWVPYSVGFWSNPGTWAMGFYDNPEAIFDPDMTIGQMCSAWAQYHGYERYELPMDAADGVKFIDAQELEAWSSGYNGPAGLTVAFFRHREKEPEYYSFSYFPSAAGPYFTIFPAEGPYVPGPEPEPSARWEPPEPDDEHSAVALINAELDELRDLGLLRSELEIGWEDVTDEGSSNITAGRIGDEFADKLYLVNDSELFSCNFCLCYDAGTRKLHSLSICPKPDDGSVRVDDVYDAGYGAVIDEDLTVGQYCALWAQYQGYERWELPAGVDEDTRYLDAHRLDAWTGGIADAEGEHYIDGLEIAFYREGQTQPEYAYVKYGPSGIGPSVTIGNDYLFESTFF